MSKEPITVVWPKDFLLPIIDDEIKQLLKYLTHDDSWRGCFTVQIVAESITARLKQGRLWRGIIQKHSEVTDDYVSDLVVEVVLRKGLAVLRKGTQMVIVDRGEGSSKG
jgi:hypothetical protein